MHGGLIGHDLTVDPAVEAAAIRASEIGRVFGERNGRVTEVTADV